MTERELQDWIVYVQSKYIDDDTQRQWANNEIEGETLKWETYKKNTYGFDNGSNRWASAEHAELM